MQLYSHSLVITVAVNYKRHIITKYYANLQKQAFLPCLLFNSMLMKPFIRVSKKKKKSFQITLSKQFFVDPLRENLAKKTFKKNFYI